jgi:hypothetical protein
MRVPIAPKPRTVTEDGALGAGEGESAGGMVSSRSEEGGARTAVSVRMRVVTDL